MKRFLLSAALAAFAVVAAQAGDAKPKAAAPAKPACCAQCSTSTKTSMKGAGTCPFMHASCCAMEHQTAAKKTMVKHALLSPKAAAAL